MSRDSFTDNKGRGRKPKFQPGELAWVDGEGLAVVVDYTRDKAARGRYRYIRVLTERPFRRVGPPKWRQSHQLHRRPGRPRRPYSMKVFKANNLLVERGCTCMCCVHSALDVSDINLDGTLAWEEE